ncbi:MAG: DUF4097 family beta strand repeat-containing protein [Defluviitaleaceae bacterium]|nr:DUF4097 family beta strand repeat-containing protein [Defluviitaleaceae bacterium]
MKKQEFISELKRGLAQAPAHIREEILADISEHFTEGIAQGMTEEEVCKNLGQPGTIAAQVLEEYGEEKRGSHGEQNANRNINRNINKNINRNIDRNDNAGGFEQVMDGIGQAIDNIGQTIDGFTRQFTDRGYEDEIDIDETFTGIRNIKVKMTDSKIRFVPSEDGNFRVTIRGHMRNMGFTVENEDGTLVVCDNTTGFRFNWFRFKSSLVTTVYVPSQFSGEIKARSTAGNITAGDVSGQINFKTAAGNVTVENHRGNRVRINTAAGNALYHSVGGRADNVEISTAAGNARITARETGRLSLTSAAGNVEAEIERLGGDTHISTAAGSVKVTVHEVAGNIDVSTAAGSAKIYLPADADIRIDAKKPVMGSITNELTGNPNSPYVLRASSSVGSIKIKAI